jgi:hypothetical protein
MDIRPFAPFGRRSQTFRKIPAIWAAGRWPLETFIRNSPLCGFPNSSKLRTVARFSNAVTGYVVVRMTNNSLCHTKDALSPRIVTKGWR